MQLKRGDIKKTRISKAVVNDRAEKLEELEEFLSGTKCALQVVQNFKDRQVNGYKSPAEPCRAAMCLFKDKTMKLATSYDGRKVDCQTCSKSVHGVCCGLWDPESWKLTTEDSPDVDCFECRSMTVNRIEMEAESTIAHLENEKNKLMEDLRLEYLYFL